MGVDAAIDITAAERETILALLQFHLPGTEAWVYGSRVKGTSTPKSDLDLVVFATPEQRRRVGDLREAFEESNLPFRVDLFVWDDVPESFRDEIETDRVTLAGAAERYGTDGWIEKKLGNVITLKRGYDLPKRDRRHGSVPVVSSSGITDHHSESKARGPGVVTGRYGTLGQVFFIENNFWPLNTALYVQDFQGNDPQFVSYLLKSLDFSDYSDKAAVPGLNRNHLHEESVRIPGNTTEQRAIAHILGTLDDKIELNRRMNATLEAMARALFKSWLVDFDPVRAKMEGRDTGLPKDIADLFPDRLVDSGLGEIPSNWESARLDTITSITKGRSYRRRELIASDTALVTLKSFARGGGYRPDGLKSFGGIYKNEHVVQPGDVIVACTDVTQAAEVIGRSAIVGTTPSFRTLVASLDVLILRPSNAAPGRAFVYHLTGTDAFVAHALARTTGTTVLHLSKDAVASFSFILPPKPLLERFELCADSIRRRIESNASAVAMLADLRDALLPRLVSGELRVTGLELASVRDGAPAPGPSS